MPKSIQLPLPPLTAIIKAWMAVIYQSLSDKPIDPYACWGLMTGFRSLRQKDKRLPSVLSFAVELEKPYSPGVHTFEPPAVLTLAGGGDAGWAGLPARVPSAYTQRLPSGCAPRFVTLRLNIHKNNNWETVHAYVQHLILTPYVKRLHIGLPRGVNNPDPGQGEKPDSLPGWARNPKVVVGVIDDTFPFAHRALRRGIDAMSTRVVGLWDQTTMRSTAGLVPAPVGFPYGVHWSHDALDTSLRNHVQGQEVDEEAVYASAEIHARPWLRRSSHAAAVMGLLAGAGRAMPHMPQTPDSGDAPLAFEPLADEAADAPVVVVQLPGEQTSVRAGRWLGVNALDGLHHLISTARRLGKPGALPPPLVVNMSYGAAAGPHDGTGMLESAIDELCIGSKDTLAVVLAAGNAHGTQRDADHPLGYLPGGTHARQPLKPGGTASFTLFIPPDKQFETYLELWFSVPEGPACQEAYLVPHVPDKSDGEVEIDVIAPDGQCMSAVQCPGIGVAPRGAPSEKIEAGLFFMRRVSQGHGRSMALLVVAATQVSSKHVEAPAGRWRITLRHKKADTAARSFSVDAWVERDDTEVGAVRPQSARLVENADGSPSGLSDENTFTSIATGRMTFKAGALMDRGNGLESTQVSAYSAEAVDDLHGPDFSSVADTHAALPGIRVSGSQSGMVLRANGTSMAAPQAARYLVNELASPKTLAQVRHELENTGRGNARLGKKTV